MKTLNIKTLLVVLFAVAISANSFAQESKGRYVLNGFWDNWYMSVGAGAQSYWGSNPYNDNTSIIDRATVTYNVSLGKWITPYFGVRAQGNYSPAVTRYQDSRLKAAGHNPQMEIINAHADATFNMSNIIGGYKDTRFYQAILYVGAGYGRSDWPDFKWDNTISANVGLINKMRIADKWDINIELAAVAWNKTFDGIVHANYPFDAQFLATGGLTYRFGNKLFEKEAPAVAAIDLSPYNNRIKELESAVSSANAKAAELQKRVMELQNKKPIVEVKQSLVDLAGASTFFHINSSKLGPRDIVNLEELAGFIKQTPDVKYKLSGLIDYASGSRAYNDKLCAARVDAVYNELVRLGIDSNQLVKSSESPTSPSKNPILNRGVVVSTLK